MRICEKQAPGLYVIRHFLFVQVPSGKMTICGQAPLVCARCLISLMVFCRELGSSRDTNTGCVKRVRAGDKRGANIRHGNRGTEITAILVYKTKPYNNMANCANCAAYIQSKIYIYNILQILCKCIFTLSIYVYIADSDYVYA